MANRDILAIGTSAGGVQALRELAGALPGDLPAAVLVVIHLSAEFESSLDQLVTQAGPLPAGFARDGEAVRHGRIYIAPPEYHLLLDGARLRLGNGPRENFSRPAIDPLFRSVAACCGPRAIGAVLSGRLGDGASGLLALKQCGAMTIVQDPADAAFPEMPNTALGRVAPDHVVRLADMAGLVERLVKLPSGPPAPVPDMLRYEIEVARGRHGSMSNMDRIGRRSVLACPDCHGVMWEIDEGELVRFRCHVGHAYAAELMHLALDENLRRALGSALRALEERIALARRLHEHARSTQHDRLAETWLSKLHEFEQEAEVIRDSIARFKTLAKQSGGS
jgi:two-component system, chemotaxis family, protein-glutamate methylesterase/glutaminase